jgi:hypothetical protein
VIRVVFLTLGDSEDIGMVDGIGSKPPIKVRLRDLFQDINIQPFSLVHS